jgi:hypothetical protein
MKTKLVLKYFLIISISLLAIIACKDVTTNPGGQDNGNYFPGSIGNTYHYSVSQTDSAGIITSGTRFESYTGDTLLNLQSLTNYIIQYDSVETDSGTSIRYSFFRRSQFGIFYYVDTSKVSLLVPDSLKDFVTLQQETRLVFLPIKNSFWFVYSIPVKFENGITFKPIEISGTYAGSENVLLQLSTGAVEVAALKVKYELKIISDITKPAKIYSAFGWFSDGIGLIKLEGDGPILNALNSSEINFDDSTSTFSQELVDYHIE